MSESLDEERERIRERKRRELRARLEGGTSPESASADAGATSDGPGTDAGSSPDEPIAIEDRGHFQSVLESHGVVLVDCHADWCGPCKMLEPTIDALAAETDAAVAKVDVDAHPGIAQQLGAMSIPTLVCFADGEPVERLVGMQDRATLEALIERHR